MFLRVPLHSSFVISALSRGEMLSGKVCLYRQLHRAVACMKETSSSLVNRSHFKTFCLDDNFDIDVSNLTKKFRSLQGQWHPDKFVSKPKDEQEEAAKESSAINAGYRILRDPLKRSLYLLELAGLPLEEGTTDLDPEFLMEIMEINERLADVKRPEQMEDIKAQNQAILECLRSSVAAAFDAKDFHQARKIVARMKYYANISAKVHSFERERGIE